MSRLSGCPALATTAILSAMCQGAVAEDAPIRLEAESMYLTGFQTEFLAGASNGAIVNLKGPASVGSASTLFTGPRGNYDIFVVYHDENDGSAQLSVSIDGVSIDTWTLDQLIPNSQHAADFNSLTRQVATDYAINQGDSILISALQGNWDNANVDYIEFEPRSQGSFPGLPIVVDFSEGGPIVIDEPGYYVLDRSWILDNEISDESALEIIADQVTFDLRGFSIEFRGHPAGILITGNSATIRNGTVSDQSSVNAVTVNGMDARITDMRIHSDSTGVFLGGLRGRVFNSAITASDDAVGIIVRESTGSIIQSNEFRVAHSAILFVLDTESVQVLDNVISCDHEDCIKISGHKNVFARNTIPRISTRTALTVEGNDNQILDNTIMDQHDSGQPAIRINGTRNMIRGNIVQALDDPTDDDFWLTGILFLQDGNFYGDNLISAVTPFEFSGTVQTDLGGNLEL